MARTDLPDVNLWLALLDQGHVHHQVARGYWETDRSSRLAFCRVTMLGLFRLATNEKAMRGGPYTFPEIWQHYKTLISFDEVSLVVEPDLEDTLASLTNSDEFRNSGWTDAYLASFAIVGRYRLVTFDEGFSRFEMLDALVLKG